jgi:hypothetical protein
MALRQPPVAVWGPFHEREDLFDCERKLVQEFSAQACVYQ